jgi:hypothetical protein
MAVLPRRQAAGRVLMAREPEVGRELQRLPDEPLLPIERKLVAWSIGVGLLLLGILIWLSRTFFPAS